MAWPLWLSRPLFALLFLLVGLQGEDGVHDGDKRDSSSDLPRMLSDKGNLVFSTGDNKEIRFQPSASGRVKVGDQDLTLLLTQISSNKADIEDLKSHGGVVPPEITNRLNQLDTKTSALETKVTSLESVVQRRACNSNPCRNGGTCLNLLDSFHCVCPGNWAGPSCATDVNECQIYSGTSQGCQNGATCLNSPGSFSCGCSPEWSGSLCTVRFDDCRGSGQGLCVHGMCIDADRVSPGQPRYQCVCDSGWQSPSGNPACVEDVDECSLDIKPCSSNPAVSCYNTQGSFSCGGCPAGPTPCRHE